MARGFVLPRPVGMESWLRNYAAIQGRTEKRRVFLLVDSAGDQIKRCKEKCPELEITGTQADGKGLLNDEAEKLRLKVIVMRAHQQGRRVRFWGAPDTPPFWHEMLASGVDLINTDNLAGAREFLLHR